MGNKVELAADMLRMIGEDITQYAGVLKWMAPFGDCEGREMGDAFMKRIAAWKALVSDLPSGNGCNQILDSCAEANASGYLTVDLGLPSGLKWADRNVGAESPEAYGDYFMRGSTTPDTDKPCEWAHAPFNNASSSFDKTYFNKHKPEWLAENGTLKPEYDAATQIMGGSWRMPTSAEMQELADGTRHIWETLGGAVGMRFTSKSNGNSIFMPYAGYRNGSDVSDVGANGGGYEWSSSLYTGEGSNSNSFCLIVWALGEANLSSYYSRCYGFSVRGVCQ